MDLYLEMIDYTSDIISHIIYNDSAQSAMRRQVIKQSMSHMFTRTALRKQ